MPYSQKVCFGAEAPYLASRLYELLCLPDGKDLTRLKFLQNLRPLLQDHSQRCRFMFNVIDSRGDECISGDEIDAMLTDFPPKTPAFKEFMQ